MATAQTFITREQPVRNSSTTYMLANTPMPNSEQVFLNGVLQNEGAANDYTISNNQINFARNIEEDEVVLVSYRIEVYVAADQNLPGSRIDIRVALIHWCLRKLGAPVIDINVDEDQIEDRVDEALMYFRDYHFDGVERCYLQHKITASTMELTAPFAHDILRGVKLTGQTSGATGVAFDKSEDNRKIRFQTTSGKLFIKGETVAIEGTTNTVQILDADSAIVLGDIDNKYISVGQKVVSITNIIPQESSSIGGNLGGMFDFQYQFALNNMFNLASTDLITYDIYQRYISQWEFMFRGAKGIRFNRKTDRVYLDVETWAVDKWIILEAWVALDPIKYTEVYSDEFVREYACSLIKLQWGANLKKYSGIQLPGGTTLNGQQLYDEALAEIDKLRERIRKEFELPPDFLVG